MVFMQDSLLKNMMEINGFHSLSKVQEKMIPWIVKKHSLIVTSPTGTGKTHAYLFGLLLRVVFRPEEVGAVILAPTRELAFQIYQFMKVMQPLFPSLKVSLLVGGSTRKEMPIKPQLVIATPGRLLDMIESQRMTIHQTQMIVIDEADMMVDEGFLPELDQCLSATSANTQIVVFSATIPQSLEPFLKKYIKTAKIHQSVDDDVFNPKLTHHLIALKHHSYETMVQSLLNHINPNQILIFSNSKDECVALSSHLRSLNLRVVELHKGLTSTQRKNAIVSIQSLKASIIVATDIAARGLDFKHVTHVISCGFPKDLTYYKHRAGRTGRAGLSGEVYALYGPKDDEVIRKLISQNITFVHQTLSDKGFKTLSPYGHKRVFKTEQDKKIVAMIKGKNKKVKPNYKKKMKQEIEAYERKKRRAMIDASVKAIRKQKYKAAAAKEKKA
jgi:ATP-dependent RNA helicase CshB